MSWKIDFITKKGQAAETIDQLVQVQRERAKSRRGPEHTNHIPAEKQVSFLQDALPKLMQYVLLPGNPHVLLFRL